MWVVLVVWFLSIMRRCLEVVSALVSAMHIFCPCDMVVKELSVQFALELAGKAGCSASLCFVFERACGVRGKRSELYVVVSGVCGINWKINVSIANFDIKRLFSICFYPIAFALPNRNPTISVHCRRQPILSFCFGSTVL